MARDSNSNFQYPPGFRFYPSDEELIVHYLLNKLNSRPLPASVIAEIELYNYNPWELPNKALFGEDEWYFFSPRDRKYPNGARPNRTAASGYWKATGTDKPILNSGSRRIGVKKALVFYKGRPPKGMKTEWIMNEYRLPETMTKPSRLKGSMRLDDWVLCRVRLKGNMSKNKWEVPDSPRKELAGYFPKIEELPSAHGNPNTNVLNDYLHRKDFHLLASMLAGQSFPPTETISNATFSLDVDGKNYGSVYDNGLDKGNSFFDNFYNPSKGKIYENLLQSTKTVTNNNKKEDLLPGNTLANKDTSFYIPNQSQVDFFNPDQSNVIINLEEPDESYFTGIFLQ